MRRGYHMSRSLMGHNLKFEGHKGISLYGKQRV